MQPLFLEVNDVQAERTIIIGLPQITMIAPEPSGKAIIRLYDKTRIMTVEPYDAIRATLSRPGQHALFIEITDKQSDTIVMVGIAHICLIVPSDGVGALIKIGEFRMEAVESYDRIRQVLGPDFTNVRIKQEALT